MLNGLAVRGRRDDDARVPFPQRGPDITEDRSDQEVVALVELDEMLVLPHFAPVDHRRGGFVRRARQVGRAQNGNQLLMQVNAIAILRMAPRLQLSTAIPIAKSGRRDTQERGRLSDRAIVRKTRTDTGLRHSRHLAKPCKSRTDFRQAIWAIPDNQSASLAEMQRFNARRMPVP